MGLVLEFNPDTGERLGLSAIIRIDDNTQCRIVGPGAKNTIIINSNSTVTLDVDECTDAEQPPGTASGAGGINIAGSMNEVTVDGLSNDVDYGADTSGNDVTIIGGNNDIDTNGSGNPPPVVYGPNNIVHD